MEVKDHEAQAWFLFEEGEMLLLEANCSHGAFGYTFLLELNFEEVRRYRMEGREYLSRLAHEVHHSAPVVKGSRSVYKGRDVSEKYSEEVAEAFERWKKRVD